LRHIGSSAYRFSAVEQRDLLKAWAILSLAFAVLIEGVSFGSLFRMLSSEFLLAFFVSGVTVGTGFLLHELGHKFVAQKYGLWAEFRAHEQGLWLALLMSFFGFIFAAPGAVMIHGHTSITRMGKIGAAGPLVNYVLGLMFFVLGKLNPISALNMLFAYGASVNAFLGLFNMIPFGMFDGKKIMNWSKLWYWMMVAAGFAVLWMAWFV